MVVYKFLIRRWLLVYIIIGLIVAVSKHDGFVDGEKSGVT